VASLSERSPARASNGPFVDPHDDSRVPLRLTATRGALGIELYEPVEVGPLQLARLSATFPGLRFPVDLSGGVPVFRHRRGDLERLEIVASFSGLSSWLMPRLRAVVGAPERAPVVWAVPQGIAVGLVGARGALAFDLLWAPLHGDARFVVSHVRGAGLDAPALAHALHAVDSAMSGHAQRRGRVVTLESAARRLTRSVFPAVGARAPATGRARFGELLVEGDELRVVLDSTFEPPVIHSTGARALELAALTVEADDALANGDLDAARAAYLVALERAPRHPEITQLIGEIDVVSAGRAEAALGLIVETLPASRSGFVGAELLARTGDLEGAAEAIAHLVQNEPFAPLCALYYLRLAELSSGALARLGALDRGVAAAPGLAKVRWARLGVRVELGDVAGALADAEHLEAAALGAAARHQTCLRSGRVLLERGFVREAGRSFERALRYVPDDPAATAGLARSLMDAGKSQRAFSLLARAVALSEKAGAADADALVDMARLLATDLEDLPQAIARVRQVPQGSSRAIEAAALEAEWRGLIGDLAGASLAWARMRDRVELAEAPPDAAIGWLVQAARFERETQADVLSAERHLAVALRLSPRDHQLAARYRELAAVVAARARRERDRHLPDAAHASELDSQPPASASEPPAPDTFAPPGDDDPQAQGDPRDVDLAQRLEGAVRANPADEVLALELADVLFRLGRDEELFALLSARLEEVSERRRADVRVRLAQVLKRLAARATQSGRVSEAALYRARLADFEQG
jgi:tetratricopeptide (TPR) repeat protein